MAHILNRKSADFKVFLESSSYEVDPTLQLGYLGVKKMVIFENHENTTREHFLDDSHQKVVEGSWIFRKFPKCVQL